MSAISTHIEIVQIDRLYQSLIIHSKQGSLLIVHIIKYLKLRNLNTLILEFNPKWKRRGWCRQQHDGTEEHDNNTMELSVKPHLKSSWRRTPATLYRKSSRLVYLLQMLVERLLNKILWTISVAKRLVGRTVLIWLRNRSSKIRKIGMHGDMEEYCWSKLCPRPYYKKFIEIMMMVVS